MLAKVSAQPHVVWATGLWTFTVPNSLDWMGKPRRWMSGTAVVNISPMTRRSAMETATLVDGSTPPGLRCSNQPMLDHINVYT